MNITYTSPIFGPVHSRRLGISLGINLLPGDGKVCSFDCIYCECGLNQNKRTHTSLPTRQEVCDALEQKLQQMQSQGQLPDVLTFAGNGEPTLNPQFPQIVDDVIALRNQYCPDAKVSVLSNSTQIHRQEVRDALLKVDNPIMKLDSIDGDYINNVDRPTGHYNVEDVIDNLAKMSPKVIIQTMIMKSTDQIPGKSPLMNDEIWQALHRIQPRQVMIYTIDREVPVSGLEKATHDEMNAVAEKIRAQGFNVSVSY